MRIALFIFPLLVANTWANEPAQPVIYDHRILETYPHSTEAFTQGLFFNEGALYESTGNYGQSSLRRVDLVTGDILQKINLPGAVFGEGAAIIGDDIFVVSWREQTAFRFNAQSFTLEESYSYDGEGWGLTSNGEALIMSDGTDELRFFDPETFSETRRIKVTLGGKPLRFLNELEWIDGRIYANVWPKHALVRIDPESGVVTGVIDLNGLLPESDYVIGKTDVLNGIAYRGEENVLYVTGKNWPKLFKIELVKKPD
mgnify:CR=1 FL=1|jgi:glutamine cyclotransferase